MLDGRLPADYNASLMLFWTDRKGFSICRGEHSVQLVDAFARAGAECFIANRSVVRRSEGTRRIAARALHARGPVSRMLCVRPTIVNQWYRTAGGWAPRSG